MRTAPRNLARILEENGLDSESDSLILRREISQGGKGRVFVNNQPATVAVLQTAGAVPGHRARAERDAGCVRWPGAAGPARYISPARSWPRSRGLSRIGTKFATRIDELERDEQDRLRLLDLWTFQKREIEDAKLAGG